MDTLLKLTAPQVQRAFPHTCVVACAVCRWVYTHWTRYFTQSGRLRRRDCSPAAG
jgi:hypothetical protein